MFIFQACCVDFSTLCGKVPNNSNFREECLTHGLRGIVFRGGESMAARAPSERAGAEGELGPALKPHPLRLIARPHVPNDPLKTVPEFGIKHKSQGRVSHAQTLTNDF